MSFNLASLIAGTSSEQKIPEVKDIKPKSTKKSFNHGMNVLLTQGTYKGYLGSVAEFYPSSITLNTYGKAYVEASKFGWGQDTPGSIIITELGSSLVEQVIPSTGAVVAPIQLFRSQNSNEIKIGRVITNNKVIMRFLVKQGKKINEIQSLIDNTNNTFITEIDLVDTILSDNLNKLTIGKNETDILIDQFTKMHINGDIPSPLDQLSKEVKTNVSLLDKITHPEYFEDELQIKIIFRRDLIGPQYYLNITPNLGNITIYNPTKNNYLISYQKPITFNPNIVTIKKQPLKPNEKAFQYKKPTIYTQKESKITDTPTKQYKYFGTITSGPYAKQTLEVLDFTPSHLAITLFSNGRTITSHVVRKINETGDYLVDKFNNPIFDTSVILPSDVFYLDLLLKNGNYFQVNSILPNGNISGIENKNNEFITTEISQNDILEIQPGFKFFDKDIQITPPEQDMFLTEQEIPEEEQEIFEEDYDNQSQEIDYASTDLEPEQQATFKDVERSFVQQRELTTQEKQFKTYILNILKLLNIHEDTINIYNIIDTTTNLVKIITPKLQSINFTTNLVTTNNIKFIITCLVLYSLIQTGFSQPLDKIVDLLFPKFFTIKDTQTQNMNENIFLMKWDVSLTDERLQQSISNIKKYLKKSSKNHSNIIQEILINADIILQNLLNIKLNIIQPPISTQELIPLGINPITGKRFKEEQVEEALAKTRKGFQRQFVTIKNLLENNIPQQEVEIIWGQLNKQIIQKFQQELQNKADTQNPSLKPDYLYIKNNLYRAPFAIRDDDIKPNVRTVFQNIYNSLLNTINKQSSKIETSKKRKREQKEELQSRREKIMEELPQPDEEDTEEIPHTKAYLKEQKLREMKSSIARATRSANIAAYKAQKQQKTEPTETTETTETPFWED